jgi:hypothetical protein
VVVDHGIFWLARIEDASRGGWLSGLTPNAVAKWREYPGTGHHQSGQPARALDEHGVGMELGPVSTGECPELLVSRALWWRRHALAAYRDGGGGAPVTHCPVALPCKWDHP